MLEAAPAPLQEVDLLGVDRAEVAVTTLRWERAKAHPVVREEGLPESRSGSHDGDRAIRRWLHQHYPGWDAEPHEFMNIGPDRYAVVYITSANNAGRRVYFRVSSGMDNDDGAMSPGMPPM